MEDDSEGPTQAEAYADNQNLVEPSIANTTYSSYKKMPPPKLIPSEIKQYGQGANMAVHGEGTAYGSRQNGNQ